MGEDWHDTHSMEEHIVNAAHVHLRSERDRLVAVCGWSPLVPKGHQIAMTDDIEDVTCKACFAWIVGD